MSEMKRPAAKLQSKFAEKFRFDNFGEILMRMRVSAFRCHRNTEIDIKSPVTAFCGLNGSGKFNQSGQDW